MRWGVKRFAGRLFFAFFTIAGSPNRPRPSLSMRHLELIVEATAAELSSALWYLKQRGLAASDDKSSLQITVDGMDFLESKKPLAEDVLTFIKPAAIASAPAPLKREQRPNP